MDAEVRRLIDEAKDILAGYSACGGVGEDGETLEELEHRNEDGEIDDTHRHCVQSAWRVLDSIGEP